MGMTIKGIGSTSVDPTSPSSIRNRLLSNISLQSHLVDTLFTSLVASSTSSSSSSSSSSHSSRLISAYTSLEQASASQAEILEQARIHQEKYEKLTRRRERVKVLEEKVKGRLVRGLGEIMDQAEEMVNEGRRVRKRIEQVQEGETLSPLTMQERENKSIRARLRELRIIFLPHKPFHRHHWVLVPLAAHVTTSGLLSYATLLAPYTSRPSTSTMGRHDGLPSVPGHHHFLYPVEAIMASGRLGELTRGELLTGKGEVEVDGVVQGESREAMEIEGPTATSLPTEAASASMATTTVAVPEAVPMAIATPSAPPQPPKARRPFKLDLDSDSEEDED